MEKAKKAALKHLAECQARIDALGAEIDKMIEEQSRCDEVIRLGSGDLAKIQLLKAERDDEIAQAFLEKREPQLASVDLKISDEESKAASALANAEAARLARVVVDKRSAELRAEIVEAREVLKREVIAEMEGRASVLTTDYAKAVESLGETLSQLVATNRVMSIFGKEPNALGFHPGEYLFDRLKKERLPVPWSHSERAYSNLVYAGANGAEIDHMATPMWMTNDQLRIDAVAALMNELAGAGIQSN